MMKNLVFTLLILIYLLSASATRILASNTGPDPVRVERETREFESLVSLKDIKGLINLLAQGTFPIKVKVATYLKDNGDERALPELKRANKKFGGWNPRSPCDDRSGIFALAIWKISTYDLPYAAKVDALLELLEGRGPIAPPSQADGNNIGGQAGKALGPARPNYQVGICAEEELERFKDSELTLRLRQSMNKGVASYAVWRDVRGLHSEDAISRCIQIIHGEGRVQQYGAIHCLRRFEDPRAILALDLLAAEGYSEAIRALDHLADKTKAFDIICKHLLENPYYVVRLFAVSAVRFTKSESLRAQSLKTLVRALYDPNDKVRNRAAKSLSNYIYPSTRMQCSSIKVDLLHALEHPDAKVRDQISKGLSRVGWLDHAKPQLAPALIRTDIEANSYPKGSGIQRQQAMIRWLESKASAAQKRGESAKLIEIYTKLSILEPDNEAYRSHLSQASPRLLMCYAKDKAPVMKLDQLELDEYQLLTDRHIRFYDWETHTIYLTPEGRQRIPASSTIGVRGRYFVIIADGQRCYMGAFWSSLSSISCEIPVINPLKNSPTSGQITIERAYPSAKFGKGNDPRSDFRIKKVLAELGKLKSHTSK
jgi:HEAT repeat protein